MSTPFLPYGSTQMSSRSSGVDAMIKTLFLTLFCLVLCNHYDASLCVMFDNLCDVILF